MTTTSPKPILEDTTSASEYVYQSPHIIKRIAARVLYAPVDAANRVMCRRRSRQSYERRRDIGDELQDDYDLPGEPKVIMIPPGIGETFGEDMVRFAYRALAFCGLKHPARTHLLMQGTQEYASEKEKKLHN